MPACNGSVLLLSAPEGGEKWYSQFLGNFGSIHKYTSSTAASDVENTSPAKRVWQPSSDLLNHAHDLALLADITVKVLDVHSAAC